MKRRNDNTSLDDSNLKIVRGPCELYCQGFVEQTNKHGQQ